MAKQYHLLIKLLVIGDSGVGKTCMIWRFADDSFHDGDISTIGIDFRLKNINIDGKTIRLQMWDTAGQERYETLTRQYYRRAQGAILVYDISNRKSFRNINKWMERLRTYVQQPDYEDEYTVFLVANKCDIAEGVREVTSEEGAKLAKSLNIKFYETSAKNADNIEELFMDLSRTILKKNKKQFDAIQLTLSRQDSDSERDPEETLSACCS